MVPVTKAEKTGEFRTKFDEGGKSQPNCLNSMHIQFGMSINIKY